MAFNNIKKNIDIFIFQLLNWTGGYFLYITFLRLFSSDIFKTIAASEVFFGAIGAFLLVQSLRHFEKNPSFRSELKIFFLRLLILMILFIFFYCTSIDFVFFIAFIPVLLTPVHLPLKIGYSIVPYMLISLKLILAIIVWIMHPVLNDKLYIAVLYFLPGIIYGLGIYLYYLYKLKFESMKIEKNEVKSVSSNFIGHFLFSLAFSYFNAFFVAKNVENGFYYGSIERLIRSSYSFSYPYIVRFNFHNNRKIPIILFFLLTSFLILYTQYKFLFLLMFVPALIDMYMTLGINKIKIVDYMTFLALLFSYEVFND